MIHTRGMPGLTRLQTRAALRDRNSRADDCGLRLTRSQEDSGIIASCCFLAFALGMIGLGIYALVSRVFA